MVPLRGNAFKRQPERLALSWSQRGDTEIHGLGIRAAGFQDLQRNVFPLDHLSYLVLELHLDYYVGHGLVAGVGYAAIDIADGRAHEILSGAHLEIGKLKARGVGGWAGRALRLAAHQKCADDGKHDHGSYGDCDNSPAGITLFGIRIWLA